MSRRKIADIKNEIKKREKENNEKNIVKKVSIETNKNIITPQLVDNVTREVLSVTTTLLKQLTPQQIEIAKEVSKTNVNIGAVCAKFKLSAIELDKLMSEPAFIAEVRRITYQDGFADKEKRIRLNSEVIKLIANTVLGDEFVDKLNDLSADRVLKTLKEFLELQNKLVEGEQVVTKIDITQIIKGKVEEERVKIHDGNIKIKNKYPTINEKTGEVEGEWSE